MIAVDPASSTPHTWLASALVARGAPIESIGEALRQASEIESDPILKQLKAIETTITLSWLTGDFAAVIASFPELDRFGASVTSPRATPGEPAPRTPRCLRTGETRSPSRSPPTPPAPAQGSSDAS
ncbi:MAG: hypothetical protein ABSE49_33850 [Polyangiaceae bacterium]|jgi:hypothetical protein